MSVSHIFLTCAKAIVDNKLIKRVGATDKEFHFQNWFQSRLEESKLNFDSPGRNSYPDFTMVDSKDGFEIKGLAYPGRVNNYDSNSQVPKSKHNGRDIYYVFGRYPKVPDGNEYPVMDLVICHGSFLNADNDYVHKNKNAKGFGSYGDIMIRDRKMYVVPTPYNLAEGLAHNVTLILPADMDPDVDALEMVGEFFREEAKELLIKYSFDLVTNDMTVEKALNPSAGTRHHFKAYRLKGAPEAVVRIKSLEDIVEEIEDSIEGE